MLDKDIEQEIETVSKELDACKKKRLEAVDDLFWRQMSWVVIGVVVMCVGLLFIGRV